MSNLPAVILNGFIFKARSITGKSIEHAGIFKWQHNLGTITPVAIAPVYSDQINVIFENIQVLDFFTSKSSF
jgi:hypothetical protein